jgi:transcription elongation factor GreA
MTQSLIEQIPWSATAGEVDQETLALVARALASIRAAEISADELPRAAGGFASVFLRGLLAGDAGIPLVGAALDDLASHGRWPELAAAARIAGAEEAESTHAAALLRALGQTGDEAGLARMGAAMAAQDLRRIPARYRLKVALALHATGDAPELLRPLLHAAVDQIGNHGSPAEVDQWLELVAERIGDADVAALIALFGRLTRRQIEIDSELELMLLALQEGGRPAAVWELARGVAEECGLLPAAVADLAAAALTSLYGSGVEAVAADLRRAPRSADPLAELQRIARALQWRPGEFVRTGRNEYWRVESCDGRQVTLMSAIGQHHTEPLDADKHELVSASEWPVRVLFDKETIRRDLRREPLRVLEEYVRYHPGKLTDLGLRAEFTGQGLLYADEWEFWLEGVRNAIRKGEGGVSYNARSRAFSLGKPKVAARAGRKPVSKKDVSRRTKVVATQKMRGTAVGGAGAGEHRLVLKIDEIPAARTMVDRLRQDIDRLDRELRIEIPRKLETAAAHGDLRENAEYDAAKQRKAHVENLLQQLLPRLKAVGDVDGVRCAPDQASVLRSARFTDLPDGSEQVVHLVPNELSDPDRAFVSVGSPLGRALNRRRVGEVVEFELPDGVRKVRLLAVGTFGEDP